MTLSCAILPWMAILTIHPFFIIVRNDWRCQYLNEMARCRRYLTSRADAMNHCFAVTFGLAFYIFEVRDLSVRVSRGTVVFIAVKGI